MTADPAGRQLLPVACTLGAEDGGQRLADWRRVVAMAGAGRAVATGKVTLAFHDRPGVRSELERLVSAERLCCAFLGWQLVPADGQLLVEVTGSDDELRALPVSQ